MLATAWGGDKGDLPGNARRGKMIYRIVEMQLRRLKTPAALLFILAHVILLHGCGEDTIPSGSTAISGRVLSTNGDPLDAGIVVEYQTVSAGASLASPQTADGKIVVKPPYPNPTTTGVVTIPIQVASDTTMRVDIVATINNGTQTIVDTPIAGRLVTQDTVVTWDGLDRNGVFPSGSVPNGMYRVRVTIPASGSATVKLEVPILINQPAAINTSQQTFNAQAFGGDYQITDIPVGEYINGANSNGTVRGREQIAESLFLTISAENYATQEVPVTITPGDVVTITTTLTPTASSIARK